MANGWGIDVDTQDLLAALAALPAELAPLLKAVAKQTAENIAREARARLQRQLGPHATGETVAAITVEEIPGGYMVWVPLPRMPNLPLWIERGTKRGKPGSHTSPARPFLYASALLEAGAYRRRIVDAITSAIDAKGLGE